ncbi:MAG: hypothetical protein KDJ47_07215 [Hyphomicrobiaceae bacterium]|nr:hypothetical protein [Hyphomicrobiaceae bacterium]
MTVDVFSHPLGHPGLLIVLAVVVLTFALHRVHVTADRSPFEGELVTSIAMFLVFATGLVASWNSLRLRGPERR